MEIPVAFTHNRKKLKGHLSRVSGGGNNSFFHLMISNYYYGHLSFTNGTWRFSSQSGEYDYLEPIIVDFVTGKRMVIRLRRSYQTYDIIAIKTFEDQFNEQWSLIGTNKTLVVENNRPTWLNRGVRHRMEWRHVSGEYKYASDLEEVFKVLQDAIKFRQSNDKTS